MTREDRIAMKVAAGMPRRTAETLVDMDGVNWCGFADPVTEAEVDALVAHLRVSQPELFEANRWRLR